MSLVVPGPYQVGHYVPLAFFIFLLRQADSKPTIEFRQDSREGENNFEKTSESYQEYC